MVNSRLSMGQFPESSYKVEIGCGLVALENPLHNPLFYIDGPPQYGMYLYKSVWYVLVGMMTSIRVSLMETPVGYHSSSPSSLFG